jgi:hypothetical protein
MSKKNISQVLFILGVFTTALLLFPYLDAHASSIWQATGSSKGYVSSGAGYETDVTVSDTGIVYTAFEDKQNGKKARVRKLDGSNWTNLADSNNPLGLISSSWGHKPIITAKGSEVYVAFSDQANGKKIRIKKWDGSSWADLSDPSYPNGLISAQQGNEPELVFDKAQNILYVAFQDAASGNRVKVMQWDGDAWSTVSDENNPEGLVSSGAGAEVALEASKIGNSLYLVYEEVSANLRLRVKKYDGSRWSDITDSAHSNGLITDTPGYSPAISVDSQDRIYLVYTYKKEGNTHIMRWDGTAWNLLGNGLAIKGKSIESTVLVDGNDNVIVAMSQYKKVGKQKKSWRVRVRKWDGQNWKDTADSSHRQGFLSKKGKGDPALAEGNGQIYVAFTDYSSRRRARVMYFNPASIQ